MVKKTLLLAFFVLFTPCAGLALEPRFSLSAGPRVDNLNWSIAASDGSPNVLSELTWKDLGILQAKGEAGVTSGILYLKGSAGAGLIFSGTNQDSDYLGNNRTLEFSRSNNSSDEGSVWDASLGAGIMLRRGAWEVAPLIGYSYHKQNLTVTDGFQVIPPTGPFQGLNSTYEARWRGPWYGLELLYGLDGVKAYGSFEYHDAARYSAEADWNLRTDFQHPKSFEHSAKGTGIIVSAGLDYALRDRWSLSGEFNLMDFQTEAGLDRTFFSDGTVSDTQLNEVNWTSYAVMMGLSYTY